MTDEAARAPGPPAGYEELDVYTRAIVDQALARGISVELLDADIGETACRTTGVG